MPWRPRRVYNHSPTSSPREWRAASHRVSKELSYLETVLITRVLGSVNGDLGVRVIERLVYVIVKCWDDKWPIAFAATVSGYYID